MYYSNLKFTQIALEGCPCYGMLGLNRDSSVYERGEAMGNPNLRRWTTTKGHVRVLARTLTDEALSGGLPVLPRE